MLTQQTKPAEKKFRKISDETIEAVKNVPILEVAIAMGHSPRRMGKQYAIFCPNPNHSTSSPHTFIEPNKNIFKCFNDGGCGASGNNAIAYYGWSEFGENETRNFLKSVKGIADLMGIPIKYEDGSFAPKSPNAPKKEYKATPIAPEIPAANDATCDKVYRAFLDYCKLKREHYEELKGRGYSDADIKIIGFRSVPSQDEAKAICGQLLEKGVSLERIPGFTQKLIPNGIPQASNHWYWTITASTGYFLPVRNKCGQINRLRIRREEGKPKYTWFSSADNLATEQDKRRMMKGGASSGAPINIVPPSSFFHHWHVGDELADVFDISTALATEGEHKSQLSANFFKTLTIGVPGVGNYRDVVPLLTHWNVKRLYLAYDMDTLEKTKNENGKAVPLFQHLLTFALELAKAGVEVLLLTWDIKDGKGLDDLIANNMLPTVANLVTKQRYKFDLNNFKVV